VSERRGMLRRTVVLLAFATMILPLFGTYLTRSGVVASQHAFAESPASGAFLVLLGTLTAGAAGLLVWRWRRLGEGAPRIESLASREAGAVFTALLFAVLILAMTAATMAPLLGKLLGDDAVQIEPEGYVRFMGPLGIVLLFFAAVCPLLAYRRTAGRRFLSAIGAPGAAAAAVLVAQLAAGDRLGLAIDAGGRTHWFAAAAFALGAFVIVAALSDILRGIVVRARGAKEPLGAAAEWFFTAGRRRTGSNLVHVGAALMLAGFGGASYQQTAQGTLQAPAAPGLPGSSLTVGDYRLTYLGARDPATEEYEETQALVRVDMPDGASFLATPSLRRYRTGAVRDTAEVAILPGVQEDVYVEVRQFLGGREDSAAFLRAHVNPLTWLVWAGSLVLFAGTFLALWPARRSGGALATTSGLRRARSYAVLVVLFTVLVAVLDSGAQAALVAAGAVLLAGLWAGGLAVHAATAPPSAAEELRGPRSDAGRDAPEGGGGRVARELEVEKMMGRWGEP